MATATNKRVLASTWDRCPSDEMLAARLEERLDDASQQAFDGHVERCEACQRRLGGFVERLNPSDALQSVRLEKRSSAPAEGTPFGNILSRLRGQAPRDQEQDRRLVADLTLAGRPLCPIDIAGEGGMAVVFRCREDPVGRDVAVKVLRHQFAANPLVRDHFRQEAQIQARLAHAGVAEVFETGELEDGRLYTIMEYRKGLTLTRRMQLRQASGADSSGLIGVFRRACEIMAYAHVRGVRHRDLKPSNIHVDDTGNVTILDWGLAHNTTDEVGSAGTERSDQAPQDSAIETISGTPGYTAPEQIRGGKPAASADVYSLGVILSELLTGQRVASGKGFGDDDVDHEQARAMILRRMRECRTQKPLSKLVERCLETDPAQRPQDSAELLSELEYATTSASLVARIETGPNRCALSARSLACRVGVG